MSLSLVLGLKSGVEMGAGDVGSDHVTLCVDHVMLLGVLFVRM